MRAPFLILPMTLALAAPVSGMAEEGQRVIFCSGDCFTVDASGARTPARKGTQLTPGQRLETGPGSYAQVKLGSDVAFGVGEKARVRLDPKGVFLDEGRIRVVGEQNARPVELRTDDSAFVLRGADIEMKKSGPSGPASPVLVKLNAGDASVSGAALTNGGVQLVSAGSVIPGAPLPAAEMAGTSRGTATPVAQAGGIPGGLTRLPFQPTPVALPPLKLPPLAVGPTFRPPTINLPPAVKAIPRAPAEPSPLPAAPRLLAAPVLNTTTGEIVTLNTAIILTVQPTYTYTTISPTLLDASLTTSLSTTTTSTTSTSLTTLSSPILTTTTLSPTTTTFNLLTSPTLSTTTTLCCTTLK
jgi:hypothetical protein